MGILNDGNKAATKIQHLAVQRCVLQLSKAALS
jgi:hypothetical protein